MPLPLTVPEPQFCDADGNPYAGGTIDTFTPGTDDPKDCWSDMGGTALQTNPIVLDAAGRCSFYGSGDYRLVLKDALGNLVWDQVTSSIVSSAMQPVVSAVTLADARHAMGIDDAIAAEASLRSSADTAEATARANADTTETNARTAKDTELQNNLAQEVTRAEAAEADLQSQIDGGTTQLWRYGSGVTDGSGYGAITFSPAFPTSCDAVSLTVGATGINCTIRASGVSAASVIAAVEDTDNSGGVAGCPFYFIAVGH